jgi:6-pyruvoyl tetrahydropterin synthase/QueD family protein
MSKVMRLQIEETFCAAHRLDTPDAGRCSNLHGHTYRVRAEIVGERGEATGWVMDFAELREVVRGVLPDHVTILQAGDAAASVLEKLNFAVVRLPRPPTAETLAIHLAAQIRRELPEGADIVRLTVWESRDNAAVWAFAKPQDVRRCLEIGQAVMLDNGAFTTWRAGREPDWPGYYAWVERWVAGETTWAVIPDVIDGGVEANDALLAQWPLGIRGAPVWHVDEPLERLQALCDDWPRVCMGSAGAYREIGTDAWCRRMDAAWNAITDGAGRCATLVHMLRGMSLCDGWPYPFASVDSSDVAQNHHRSQNTAARLAARWDRCHCPEVWSRREQLEL